MVRTYILRFRYWPFRAVALSWINFRTSRALSNIALRTRACFIPFPLTLRMQPSRTNITTSKYKSKRLDYLLARTPAITISRSFTISPPFARNESLFRNWGRSWEANEENDGELAEHLAGLELSERLNSNRSHSGRIVCGAKSRRGAGGSGG